MSGKVEESAWDEKLSYSSMNTLNSCSRKYYLYKVKKAPVDSDAEVDTHALRSGKAFHELLEETMHDISKMTTDRAKEIVKSYDLNEDDLAHVVALTRNYQQVRSKTDLVAVACEIQVSTPTFNGYIDVVLKEKGGDGWWIGDLKTGASYDNFLNPRLHLDLQLNLYAYHAQEVAALCKLDVRKFKGCRYLLAVKSRVERKEGESLKDYMLKLTKACTYYEIPVPIEEMRPTEVYTSFKSTYGRAKTLHKADGSAGLLLAQQNFSSCTKFFKPCEYWSQCYGKEFTKSLEREVLVSGEG